MSVGLAIYFESLCLFQVQNLRICGYVLRLAFFSSIDICPLVLFLVSCALSGKSTKGQSVKKQNIFMVLSEFE